jgi:hypothetical protein
VSIAPICKQANIGLLIVTISCATGKERRHARPRLETVQSLIFHKQRRGCTAHGQGSGSRKNGSGSMLHKVLGTTIGRTHGVHPTVPNVRCSSLSSSQASLATMSRYGLNNVRCSSLSSSHASLATMSRYGLTNVWCSFFGRNLHSRMPLYFTPLLRLKLLHACDQWHSSLVLECSLPLTSWHCKFNPNTEGTTRRPLLTDGHEFRHFTDDVTTLKAHQHK